MRGVLHVRGKWTGVSMLVLGMAPVANGAQAQDASENTPVLGEIVITARKQGSESLQDVPASIQVFDGGALERQQIEGFDDYFRQVPSLSAVNQGPGQTQIVMRGITSGRISHAQPQTKSTTGVYIDDIPVSAGAFNPDLALFDVERIEVLRGPQGTLYGAGVMSGAIRILTREPNAAAFEATAEASGALVSHGDTDVALRGMMNVPLADDVAMRAVGYYQSNSGYVSNTWTGEDDYNSDRQWGGRLFVKYAPNADFSLKAGVIYHRLKADGRPDVFTPGDPTVAGIAGPGEPTTVEGGYEVNKFVDDSFDDELLLANVVIDHDFGAAALTSSTSYFERAYLNFLDDTYRVRSKLGPLQADGTSPLISPFRNRSRSHSWTNETRLSAGDDGPVRGVVGTFVSFDRESFVQDEVTPGLDDLLVSYGLPPSAAFGAAGDSIFDGSQKIRQRQFAVFGEVTVELADGLELLGGLRGFAWRQTFDLRYAGLANDGVTAVDLTTKESGVNPKVQLSYTPAEDVLTYIQAAKGFRLGGVNDPIPTAGVFGTNCATDLASRGLDALPETFKSDSLWNYEAGFKSKLADNRITLNAALFHIDWKNIQTSVFLPCGFSTIVNVGKVRSRGMELEAAVALSRTLKFSFGGSYTDAKLKEAGIAFDAQAGDSVPNVPRWLLNTALDFSMPLDGDRSVFMHGDLQFVSASRSDFESVPSAQRIPSATSANISIGYAQGPWEASIFLKNIWDERIVTALDTDRNVPPTYSIARPRTVGITLRYKLSGNN